MEKARTTRIRQALRDNLRDLLAVVVALGMLGNMLLLVVILRAHLDVLRECKRSVAEIARWQGPTSAVSSTTFDGRPLQLGVQEARGPADVENLVERTRDGLKRLARKEP